MLLFVDIHRTILYKSILLSILLGAIALTSYCKDSSDQKIQQLQEAWLQKAQELSDLGEKVAQKYRLLKTILRDMYGYWDDFNSNLAEQEKIDYKKLLNTTIENINPKLTQAFSEKVNVRGFVRKEVLYSNENHPSFNMAHFGLIRIIFEGELLAKLVKQYENCLQELAEIDHELTISTQQ